jgi:hypothetical protein
MRLKHHLTKSLLLQPAPSPWPRMILSALSVGLPLIVGLSRGELRMAIYGSLFGFVLILNDHFGSLSRRILHLLTTYSFLIAGFLLGSFLSHSTWSIFIVLFGLAFVLAKSKGLGVELERMLLFSILQFLTASQSATLREHFIGAFFYSILSLSNYLICLCVVYFFMKHKSNFQRSKREEFKEALEKKDNLRFTLTMAITACLGLFIAQYLHFERGNWVVGTILIVMMPDHYQSLYKIFQRILGTFIGVIIASFMMKLSDTPWMQITFCISFAFLAPLGMIRNYWLGNVFIAGLILFLLDISSSTSTMGDFDLALIRMSDIGLGCFLGALGTLVAFPQIFQKRP